MSGGSFSSRSKFVSSSAHPAVTLDSSGNQWTCALINPVFFSSLSAASLKYVSNAKCPFHCEGVANNLQSSGRLKLSVFVN